MKKILIILAVLFSMSTQAQDAGIFEKLMTEIKAYQLDTTTVPADKLTKKITELRKLRGGFNITEAVAYKIAEERTKENANKEELDKLEAFFTTGNGKKWLDNAITWIYRKQFSYAEVNTMVQFYKTPAGQKMAGSFPVIMLQSLKAAETIQEQFKP
ncbi:DUF2059 domain-containing protein [Terrimonas rubra]|uniref:DUF2059 domain-containing protein n=1 Tax=Terrimonas rubra TaxID=1035890 RepID=A0ABW6AAB8_9BACT